MGKDKKNITRKKFLKQSLMALTSLSLPISGLTGCELEFSPYETKVDHENLNAQNYSIIQAIEAAKGGGTDFKIGLFSDTHHYHSQTCQIVDIINSYSDLDFAIISGDLTNFGLLREYNWTYDILKNLRIPYVTAIGNHDCLCYGMEIYNDMFGPLNYNFTFCDVEFIFFHNNNWEGGTPNYDWLEYIAVNSTATYKILISHISNLNRDENRFSQAEVDRFNNILTANSIDLTIHGHEHKYSRYENVVGVDRYTTGSAEFDHYSILTHTGATFNVDQY